jgi:DNA-directed RNA polymerase specialized sigma24 family protein
MTRRRNSTHPEASLDEILVSQPKQLPHEVGNARPDPEKIYAAIEINALIEEHVRRLPPGLQAAFRLRAINGLSAAQSSRVLGISASAFKSRFFRARAKVASALQQSLAISAIALVLERRGRRIPNR